MTTLHADQTKGWHRYPWPALAWVETGIKSIALVVGVFALVQAVASGAGFVVPNGVRLAQVVILALLALGLVAAIADRVQEREVVGMVFVIANNFGHWSMVAALFSVSGAAAWLVLFSALMLLGDLVKLWFVQAHHYTVRQYGPSVLMGLTGIYVVGYAALLLLSRFGH